MAVVELGIHRSIAAEYSPHQVCITAQHQASSPRSDGHHEHRRWSGCFFYSNLYETRRNMVVDHPPPFFGSAEEQTFCVAAADLADLLAAWGPCF